MKAVNESKKKDAKYSVLYADVPWAEQSWSVGSTSGLCVDNWVAKDALLMLWVPNAWVPDGLSVLRSWGFDYVGLLCWKQPEDEVENILPTRICEYMLVGVRGTVNTPHLLRNMLYEGPVGSGGYKPLGFRRILAGAGYRAFGESANYLDVFGQYWKNRFPDYEKGSWEFLVDF